jgi:biopolymer transport protein ExbB/TolQ
MWKMWSQKSARAEKVCVLWLITAVVRNLGSTPNVVLNLSNMVTTEQLLVNQQITIDKLRKELKAAEDFHEYETHMLKKQLAELRESLCRKFHKELEMHLDSIRLVADRYSEDENKSINAELHMIKSITAWTNI